MKKYLIFTFLFCTFFVSASTAQTKSNFLTNLCQRWQLESIEIKASGNKFPPDKTMSQNYLQFNPDGVFNSQENGTAITGKWKADELTKELVTYEFDNQNLTSPVIFKIETLTGSHLAISNNPAGKEEVIMHYVARKIPKKNKK